MRAARPLQDHLVVLGEGDNPGLRSSRVVLDLRAAPVLDGFSDGLKTEPALVAVLGLSGDADDAVDALAG